MSRISSEIYDQVVLLHVKAYSMENIVRIIGGGKISKTTVHNIIHDWNRKISAGNIEDIRFFMRTLRESGISIEDCIEGFRIQQMLKEFESSDESYDWIMGGDKFTNGSSSDAAVTGTRKHNSYNPDELRSVPKEETLFDLIDLGKGERIQTNEKKNGIKKSNSSLDVNPVSLFVQTLYNQCKTHKVSPSTAVKWIRDTLDFFSVTTSFSNSTSNEQSFIVTQDYVNDNDEGYDDISNHVSSNIPHTRYTNFPNFQTGQSASLIDLPLVSKVPLFIVQNKENINRLCKTKKKIIDRIQKANEQKIKIESEVEILIKKHKEIFRYYRWYKNLDQELSAKYNIKLENEIENFCRAINDFEHYEYDPWLIISVYKNIESLHQNRESILQEISIKTPIRDHLSRQVSYLNDQLGWYNQTISIYNELCIYGFGLKDLKILRQTLAQIAAANNIRPEEIGRKFLKDVEDHYDDKIGFENKISELKIEKTKIEEEIPNYKSPPILQRWAIPSLLHLYNNGVTDQDIIFTSHLVSDFKNDDFLSSFLRNRNDHDNIIIKVAMSKLNTRYNNNKSQNNNYNKQDKHDDWKLFIQKLKESKNLDDFLKSQNLQANNLYDQINELTIRKQNLESHCTELAILFKQIYSTFSDMVRWSDYINNRINSQIMTSSRFTPVIIYLNNTNNNNHNNEDKSNV